MSYQLLLEAQDLFFNTTRNGFLNNLSDKPTAAQRLIDVTNDKNNRGYVVVQAVESLFRIIDRGITDRENAEQLREIKELLNALEGGKVVDI